MKNKILNKIILFVVFATLIISSFVFPSFAYETLPVANTYYRVNNDLGYSADYLVLPDLNFSVAPSSEDIVNVDLSSALCSSIPVINYAQSTRYDYSIDLYDIPNSDYNSFGFIMNYDRGRVYDNIEFLGDNFVGVMNDNNYVEGLNYTGYYNEGSVIESITSQNLFLNNSYYSSITFNTNVGNGMSITYDYGIEYFDTVVNDFVYDKVTTTITPVTNSDGTYTYSIYLAPSYYISSLIQQSVVLIKSLNIDFIDGDYDHTIMLFGDGVDTSWDIRLACSFGSYYGTYLENELNSMASTFYNNGYDTGFEEGFNVGASNLTPFDSILSAVNSFISWEFIPGISIGIVLSIVIGVSLLVIFLKVFAGG